MDTDQLIETNRRLNRRCQQAESELHQLQKHVNSAVVALRTESQRASRYATALRDIYHNHIDRDGGAYWSHICVMCRWRRWLRHRVWERWFSCGGGK